MISELTVQPPFRVSNPYQRRPGEHQQYRTTSELRHENQYVISEILLVAQGRPKRAVK